MNLTCVMIVDDSEPDQFLCKIVIENYDPKIKILKAYDGMEALEVLSTTEQKPDVIFLDINMPGMDGHTFLANYDKSDMKKTSVIVMLTSSEQKADKEKSMAYHFVKSYLNKPLEAEDLDEIIQLLS